MARLTLAQLRRVPCQHREGNFTQEFVASQQGQLYSSPRLVATRPTRPKCSVLHPHKGTKHDLTHGHPKPRPQGKQSSTTYERRRLIKYRDPEVLQRMFFFLLLSVWLEPVLVGWIG